MEKKRYDVVCAVMSRNLSQTSPFRARLFLEHPKHERLSQTSPFRARWRIVLLIIVMILLPAATAQQDLSAQLQNSSVVKTVEQGKTFLEEKKWEYVGREWKALLLNNTYVAPVDAVLRKADSVFVVLFGQHYNLSLTLLFAILFWIFFFMMFGHIFADFSLLSKGIAYLVAALLAVISAQLKIYHWLSLLVFKVIFYKAGVWQWAGFGLFFLVYVFVLAFLGKIIQDIGFLMKRADTKAREERQKQEQKSLHRLMKEINKGLKS